MEKIAILTSGGDAPGMNATIRSVVRSGIYENVEVYGIRNGFEGLIDGDLFKMNESSVADIIQRGGTILGTSRSERFKTEEGRHKALQVLKVYGINKVIVAGGDGSFKGGLALSKYGVDVVCIPLSIDNDLGYTDYSIGFFTAVDTVVDAISKIRDTTESHARANIVEVMGRECGDIALYAGLAGGAENIIVPERDFDINLIAKKALIGKNRGKRHHIIILAEGAAKEKSAYDIASEFQDLTNIDTRVTILGYIQRGGSPNIVDRILASTMGNFAVKTILSKNGAYCVGSRSGEIILDEIEEAINKKRDLNDNLKNVLDIISI